ncbi:MAG: DUF3631 domain-containing protein [Bacteroidota bacterium]
MVENCKFINGGQAPKALNDVSKPIYVNGDLRTHSSAVTGTVGPVPSSEAKPKKSKSARKLSKSPQNQKVTQAPSPWPEQVNGAELLHDIVEAIKRHVALPAYAAEMLALWGVGTHAMQTHATVFPRLLITSIDAECGKSLILEVLANFTCRPCLVDDASSAAIYRLADAEHPTFLLDEADTWLTEQFRGILNSGHKSTGGVLRCEGDDFVPTWFGTYAAMAIARIGHFGSMYGPLLTRSIILRISRSSPDEHKRLKPFTEGDKAQFHIYARKIQRWLPEGLKQVDAYPPMPDFLVRRTKDNWRFLFRIAYAAGGDWPRIVAKVAAIYGKRNVDGSVNTDKRGIMSAVKAVLDSMPRVDRIRTTELCKQLGDLEGFPEAHRFRNLNERQAGRILYDCFKDFAEIGRPQKIRFGDSSFQGYYTAKFRDVFARYDIKTIEEIEEADEQERAKLLSNGEDVCSV